jgi:hypothetical protein
MTDNNEQKCEKTLKFKYFNAIEKYEHWLKNTKWYFPILIFYSPFFMLIIIFTIIGNYFPYNDIILMTLQFFLVLFVVIGYPFIKRTMWYAPIRILSKIFSI